MAQKTPSPLQAAFWLSKQERLYILIISILFLLGLGSRYLYLKNRKPSPPLDQQVEQAAMPESSDE